MKVGIVSSLMKINPSCQMVSMRPSLSGMKRHSYSRMQRSFYGSESLRRANGSGRKYFVPTELTGWLASLPRTASSNCAEDRSFLPIWRNCSPSMRGRIACHFVHSMAEYGESERGQLSPTTNRENFRSGRNIRLWMEFLEAQQHEA